MPWALQKSEVQTAKSRQKPLQQLVQIRQEIPGTIRHGPGVVGTMGLSRLRWGTGGAEDHRIMAADCYSSNAYSFTRRFTTRINIVTAVDRSVLQTTDSTSIICTDRTSG